MLKGIDLQQKFSRRNAIKAGAMAAAAMADGADSFGATEEPIKIIGFSKAFAHLNFEEAADLVAEVGWAGIECPVRSRSGHILPERVEEDLPRLAEALKRRDRVISIVTTEATKLDPSAEKILRTAAKLGIRKYRLGYSHYSQDQSPADTLSSFRAKLKDFEDLNKELDLQGGWQNHSGADYVGAAIWDLWSVVKDLDPKRFGIYFDLAHATIEAGLSWPTAARLVAPLMLGFSLKDYRWRGNSREPEWCPLGGGILHSSFAQLRRDRFPIELLCQHHEYRPRGSAKELTAIFKQEMATLEEWLAA